MSIVDQDQDQQDGSGEQTETHSRRRLWPLFKRKNSAPDNEETTSRNPHSSTQVGQLLWETRQDKKLTLEQAESVTRIRTKYLAALEAGEYDQLPTSGHVYGFLRNYATFLGLDWKEIQALHAQEQPQRHLDPGIFHPKDIVLLPRRFGLRVDLILGLVIALTVGVVGFWAFWEYGRPLLSGILSPKATVSATTPAVEPTAVEPTAIRSTATRVSATMTATRSLETATPQATSSPEPTVTATPASLPVTRPSPTATLDVPLDLPTQMMQPTETPTTPTLTEGVTLVIEIVERAWLQVTLDGQDQLSGILEAGETREWTARDTIYLICGNAGGVNVTVNGEDLGLLGERAQVVEKMWGPQGEVTSTPEAEEAEPGAGATTPTVEPTPTQ